MEGDLPHEHEERNHGQVVGAENGEDVLGHEAQGRIPGDDRTKSDEPDEGHEKADRHPAEKQDDQCQKPDDADGCWTHSISAPLNCRKNSMKRTTQSRAHPTATP